MAAGMHFLALQGCTYRPPSGRNGRCRDAEGIGFNTDSIATSTADVISTKVPLFIIVILKFVLSETIFYFIFSVRLSFGK